MPSSFQFQRLCPLRNEVRLIKLFPGADYEPIRCDSHVISLDDNPESDALSYAWGVNMAREPIQISEKSFTVSEKLLSALKSLRLLD